MILEDKLDSRLYHAQNEQYNLFEFLQKDREICTYLWLCTSIWSNNEFSDVL